MKLSSTIRILIASAFALGMTSTSHAEDAVKYSGDFSLQPRVMHSSSITGKMTVKSNGTEITNVTLDLDAPIYGKTQFLSKTQWGGTGTQAGKAIQEIVFALQGPTHTWFFVAVMSSTDGGQTQAGSIYKAKDTFANIQSTFSSDLPATIANWTSIGSLTLKTQ